LTSLFTSHFKLVGIFEDVLLANLSFLSLVWLCGRECHASFACWFLISLFWSWVCLSSLCGCQCCLMQKFSAINCSDCLFLRGNWQVIQDDANNTMRVDQDKMSLLVYVSREKRPLILMRASFISFWLDPFYL